MKKLITFLAIVAVFGLGVAQAVYFPVLDANFDAVLHPPNSSVIISNFGGTDPNIPGWYKVPTSAGMRIANDVMDPSSASGNNYFSIASDASDGGLYQDFPAFYKPNETYTLKLLYTMTLFHPGRTFRMSFRDPTNTEYAFADLPSLGYTSVPPDTGTPDQPDWTELTLVLDTSVVPAAVGHTVRIQFHGVGHSYYDSFPFLIQRVDDVSLLEGTAGPGPIPEPAGLGLMGVALLALRKRRS